MVHPVESLTVIPEGLETEAVAPLLCGTEDLSRDSKTLADHPSAGLTIYSAIMRAGLKPGQWIVLPGAGGGLGHL
jgi:propanol-preferring alcohol dehydrogenase